MKRIRIAGLCLVAVVATSAVAAATAMAEAPEYGRCLSVVGEKEGHKTVYHGGYTNNACTKVSEEKKGKFEWYPGVVENKFKANIRGLIVLKTHSVHQLSCEGGSYSGEYSGTKTVGDVVFRLKACEVDNSEEACTSPGAAAGEVVTSELEGRLGWEKDTGSKKVALDLLPAQNAPLFLECGRGDTVIFSVRGSVLGPVSDDKMLMKPTVKYIASKGKQKQQHFEGEPNDVLESSFEGEPFEDIGLSLEATQENEEPVEINAVA